MPNLHVITGAGESPTFPIIGKIGFADLKDAAAKGIDDFLVMPTHVIFLAIVYPLVGLFLARMTSGYDVMPLLYPLAAGFGLIAPFAAIGLYELSRQREKGVDVSWKHAFGVLRSRSLGGIAALGMVLTIVFLIWLTTAHGVYPPLPQRHLNHHRRLDPHRRRKRYRLSVRCLGADDQRRFLPAAAGSGCRRDGRDAHVGQSGSSQSADDGGLGALRRRHPGDRLVAVLHWA